MENELFLALINQKKAQEITKIKNCNDYISKYGLILTEKDINNIVEKRIEVLQSSQRLEFGDWIVDKLIMEFCDSPYIQKEEFADIISELLDMFYYYKNETKDLLSDNELIEFMKKSYDGICQGSLEYLEGTVLDKMANNVLNGKAINYSEINESDEKYE